MLAMRSRRMMGAIVLTAAFVACSHPTGPGSVDLRVAVTVPAEISSVGSGVLRLQLWAYDPRVADASADLIGSDSVKFVHHAGTRDAFLMRVRGRVPAGLRHYLTIRGYDLAPDCERYVLWDGARQTGLPASVTMRAVPIPTCVH